MTTNQSPSNEQATSETNSRWSLIPVLSFAGFLSAIWTDGFIWFPTMVWVQSGTALAGAVGVTVAAHFLEELGDR